MTSVAKKGFTLLVIAFAGFYLLTQPQDAAGAVKGAITAIGDAFDQVVTFFSALFK